MFTLNIKNSITISSELSESEVSAIPDVNVRDIKNGYVWYALPAITISGQPTIFNLCFFNKKIRSLNISLSNQEKYGGSWSEFSESKEILRAEDTENLLYELGYKTGKFSWGEICCGCDAKSGSGYAVVRYAL
jgi:hypothetical protein